MNATSAALLAQIFPTLLIALAIEARGVRGQFKTRLGILRFVVRCIALISSLVATFVCIVAVTNGDPGAGGDWWVTVAFWSMFAALLLFVNNVITKEIEES